MSFYIAPSLEKLIKYNVISESRRKIYENKIRTRIITKYDDEFNIQYFNSQDGLEYELDVKYSEDIIDIQKLIEKNIDDLKLLNKQLSLCNECMKKLDNNQKLKKKFINKLKKFDIDILKIKEQAKIKEHVEILKEEFKDDIKNLEKLNKKYENEYSNKIKNLLTTTFEKPEFEKVEKDESNRLEYEISIFTFRDGKTTERIKDKISNNMIYISKKSKICVYKYNF